MSEAALPGLVISGAPDQYDNIIVHFRATFGSSSLVYQMVDKSHLVAINTDGSRGDPQVCTDINAGVLFWPASANACPPKDQLLSLYMAVITNGVNLALVSHDLATGHTVTIGQFRDHLMFTRAVTHSLFHDRLADVPFTGKILRVFPPYGSVVEQRLDDLVGAPVNIDSEGFFSNASLGATAATPFSYNELPGRRKTKPVVMVFPIFLAVGGVERNTIEIIRQLRDVFDFVIVTMERLRPEQGSLATQAFEVAASVIEMSEITRHSHYLSILGRLKSMFQPDLVWVCNGSPWFCDNALEIRQLFIDTPIVDQEVYDESRGWITRYGEPGIQSFDHFIAVNQKIQQRFIHDFSIDAHRISLIYSAIDTSRITQFKASMPDSDSLRDRYGLPRDKRIFTFIARLTRQKRPLLFLEIAKSRLHRDDECYVFVGDGELAQQSLDFIERHGLTNVVRIPFIENTLELHAISDGIIFTSEYEGLPIAMLEALAMGVPAFSTDVGDVAYVLNEYQSGEVISPSSSTEQLVESYGAWLVNHGDFAAELRANEEKILERFSSINISRQYESCWNGLIAHYQKASA